MSASTGPLVEGQAVLQFAYATPNPDEFVNPGLLWDVGFGEHPNVGLDHRPLYPVKHHMNDILRFAVSEALPTLFTYLEAT